MSGFNEFQMNFGALSLTMGFSFLNEKMDSVACDIYCLDPDSFDEPKVLYQKKIILDKKNNTEKVNTRDKSQHSTDVRGEMYLSENSEKLIFEGYYFEKNGPADGLPFWLEIEPFQYEIKKIKAIIGFPGNHFYVLCPDYPASAGSLSFQIKKADNTNTDNPNIVYELNQKELSSYDNDNSNDKQIVQYLSAILSPDQRLIGINTKSKTVKHYTDFIGDVGFRGQIVYMDGVLTTTENEKWGNFYIEIGI